MSVNTAQKNANSNKINKATPAAKRTPTQSSSSNKSPQNSKNNSIKATTKAVPTQQKSSTKAPPNKSRQPQTQKTTAKGKKRASSGSITQRIADMTQEQLILGGYILTGVYIVFLAYRYIVSILKLQPVVISNNILLDVICAAIPFGIWAYSTKFDKFSFHNRKKIFLYIACGSAVASIVQPIVYLAYTYLVTKIVKIEVTENMTAAMVINLGRLAIVIPVLISVLLIAFPLKEMLTSVKMQDKINNFKITHHIDMRENKTHLYDLSVMKDIDTGKERIIKENDRFLHLFINGASGTGKTSSTIIPAIANDLDKKMENQQLREKELLQMVVQKKCYVLGPVANISEYNVRPYPKYKEEFLGVYKKYPDCGVTVMAPDASLNDDVVKLCEARGIVCNVIDPSKFYDNMKCARRKGINPFYIQPDLSEDERLIAINNAATAFTQVILTANQTQGPGDPYFGEINDSVTTNIAIAVMLANAISKRQTNITEIQQCINNFADLTPYIKTIEDYYQIDVKASEIVPKKQQNSANNTAITVKNANSASSNLSEGRDNKYYQTIQFIKQELLGPGQEKMYDQARGLRNLINFILRDPRYMELLSVPPELAINFDEILHKSQVTVINTALEFGQKKSTAFGLFNLLNFAIAVKKRLEDPILSPHFLWIDEASQWMHPVYDELINLWRKYKVSGNLAMQSVSQMEKLSATAYLKEVILKAGTQIVFGRVSSEEMKMYSELAGITKEEMVQRTTAASSMFAANASQSISERTTPNNANNLEGSDIRIRDFQEVTVFTVDNGRVIPGFVAKLNFAPKSSFVKRTIPRVNWKKYLTKKRPEVRLTEKAQEIKDEHQSIIEQNRTNVTIIENNVDEPKVATDIDEAIDVSSIFNASIFEDEAIEDTTLSEDEEIIYDQTVVVAKDNDNSQTTPKENTGSVQQSMAPTVQAETSSFAPSQEQQNESAVPTGEVLGNSSSSDDDMEFDSSLFN